MPSNIEESCVLLGVASTSSPHEILKAYSSRKSQLETQMRDAGLSFDEKNEIFKEINQIRKAYQALLALPEAPDRGEDAQSCASFPGTKTEPAEGATRLAAIHDISSKEQDEGDPVCSREKSAPAREGEFQDGAADPSEGACCWWFC